MINPKDSYPQVRDYLNILNFDKVYREFFIIAADSSLYFTLSKKRADLIKKTKALLEEHAGLQPQFPEYEAASKLNIDFAYDSKKELIGIVSIDGDKKSLIKTVSGENPWESLDLNSKAKIRAGKELIGIIAEEIERINLSNSNNWSI